MTIKVTTAADAAKKFVDVTPGRQSYYEAGVKAAGPTWEANTAQAAASYKAAVSAGNIQQLFAGGVKRAGPDKYVTRAGTLGPGRFSQGVQAAGPDYQANVEPFFQTLQGLTLTARAPRGSASNLDRVRQVATALNTKRLQLRAAGA